MHHLGDVTDVIDLVLTGLDDLIAVEPLWHVSSHSHAQPVGFLPRVHPSHAQTKLPRAIDDARRQNSWTQSSAGSNSIADGGNKLELIAAVPNSRDSGGKINWPPFHLFEMGMHVPEAGKDS